MANEINTDVAVELNITARRNDTFKMLLEVRDPNDSGNLINLDIALTDDPTKKQYEAKMTIINLSGDEVLSLFSETWNGVIEGGVDHPVDSLPSPSSPGYYTGTSGIGSAIFLGAQDGTGGKVAISAPSTYMDFQSGEYLYDFQMRRKVSSTTTEEYTTWLYGKFILKADITQL
tara:strand:+ start:39380 stop:39901 length:522 start_codon:yes stop_codon:yes gene_type:complete